MENQMIITGIKTWKYMLLLSMLLFHSCKDETQTSTLTNEAGLTAIAIHGGAGNLKKMNLTPEEEAEYISVLNASLDSGYAVLSSGGTSEEAVVAAIKVLENSPLFNAGKGSVFNHDGINEMDAAIMRGSDYACGAATGLRHVKNPITAARSIMNHSDFIFLSGKGAEEFAVKQGIEMVDSSYFFTPFRWEQLQEAIAKDSVKLDHSGDKSSAYSPMRLNEEKFGTVGCVALDKYGNIAAGTSTGGLTNKRWGRIGDSPIIGAGTYAENSSCAVSCTGKGEDFIRLNIAHDIASMVKYQSLPLDSAVNRAIQNKLKSIKGRGGCIALDRSGNISASFTTSGMFRGYIDKQGVRKVLIYEEHK